MHERPRPSLSPFIPRLGLESDRDETVSLPRLPPPFLRIQVRREVCETANSGRAARPEVAPQDSLETNTRRTASLCDQLAYLPGGPLLPGPAAHRLKSRRKAARR